MGDGSPEPVIDTGLARVGGLTCWEDYMPLARFHLYAQGVEVWIAPTLALGDSWAGLGEVITDCAWCTQPDHGEDLRESAQIGG